MEEKTLAALLLAIQNVQNGNFDKVDIDNHISVYAIPNLFKPDVNNVRIDIAADPACTN